MDTLTKYNILKETEKALLLENPEGKQFWIQKRWMKEDGTLTKSGLLAEKEALTPSEKLEFENIKINEGSIIEKRENAIKVKANVYVDYAPKGGFTSSLIRSKSFSKDIWLPMFAIKNIDGQLYIKKDFLNKKANEVGSSFVDNCIAGAQLIYASISF